MSSCAQKGIETMATYNYLSRIYLLWMVLFLRILSLWSQIVHSVAAVRSLRQAIQNHPFTRLTAFDWNHFKAWQILNPLNLPLCAQGHLRLCRCTPDHYLTPSPLMSIAAWAQQSLVPGTLFCQLATSGHRPFMLSTLWFFHHADLSLFWRNPPTEQTSAPAFPSGDPGQLFYFPVPNIAA